MLHLLQGDQPPLRSSSTSTCVGGSKRPSTPDAALGAFQSAVSLQASPLPRKSILNLYQLQFWDESPSGPVVLAIRVGSRVRKEVFEAESMLFDPLCTLLEGTI